MSGTKRTANSAFGGNSQNEVKRDSGTFIIPDLHDDSLPKELKSMFKYTVCDLCSSKIPHITVAKMHYASKNHKKKVRDYLIDYASKTETPPHPKAMISIKTEDANDPKNFYCEACDIPLTGKSHATSHYAGKSHNSVINGLKDPPKKKKKLPEGDDWDSFGLDFRKKEIIEESPGVEVSTSGPHTCSICSISCSNLEQMKIHFAGAKHRKKLAASGLSLENFELPQKAGCSESKETTELKTQPNGFSKYRTPSGSFYCKVCNTSLNSEMQLHDHLRSKNHAKKSAKN